MAQKYCVLFFSPIYQILRSLSWPHQHHAPQFLWKHLLVPPQALSEIGNRFVSLANTNHPIVAAKGPLLKKKLSEGSECKDGLVMSGLAHVLESGVLLRVLFILYYLHPIYETKILWPNVLDQSPFCLNLGQSASTGIKVENPSRFSPLFCHSRRLSKAHGGLPLVIQQLRLHPQNQRMRV